YDIRIVRNNRNTAQPYQHERSSGHTRYAVHLENTPITHEAAPRSILHVKDASVPGQPLFSATVAGRAVPAPHCTVMRHHSSCCNLTFRLGTRWCTQNTFESIERPRFFRPLSGIPSDYRTPVGYRYGKTFCSNDS